MVITKVKEKTGKTEKGDKEKIQEKSEGGIKKENEKLKEKERSSKSNMSIVTSLVALLCAGTGVILLCFIVMGMNSNSDSNDLGEGDSSLNNTQQVMDVRESKNSDSTTLFTYQLSTLEKQVINELNNRRGEISEPNLRIDTGLSELGKEYLSVRLSQGTQNAKSKIGDIESRRNSLGIFSQVSENILKIRVINESNTVQELVQKLSIEDLYSRETIGIAIIKENKDYHVLLNLY